ncbi:MAG: hypothetical protein HQ516_00850 [Chlorobium sp.]|nr:hypothetical protein [Chlorobium phaeovibrioides]NQU45584.1 hypothetical protein [Chlorobium sp.]
MAEEIKNPFQENEPVQEPEQDVVKGDLGTIIVGVATLLDSAIAPMGKVVAQALDAMTVVAQQILEGVSTTLGEKK